MAKVFDRLLLFLYTLVVLGACGILFACAWGFISADKVYQFTYRIYMERELAVPFLASIGAVALVSVRLFMVSVSRDKGERSIDQQLENGDVRISVETIENLAHKAAMRVKGNHDIQVRVRSGQPGQGMRIELKAMVDGETSIPGLTEAMQLAVKKHVQDITGLTVASVSITVDSIKEVVPIAKSRVE